MNRKSRQKNEKLAENTHDQQNSYERKYIALPEIEHTKQYKNEMNEYTRLMNEINAITFYDIVTKLEKIAKHNMKLNKKATAYIKYFFFKKKTLHVSNSKTNHEK